ncbi:trypsin-like [Trachinotus anak]|uniref:trypsin-like n=1 Tax=Trachinotus anak TaxID=443729 RepID=UPI0039F1ABAC
MTAMARLVLLYFLLWVGVTVSTAVDLQKRIIGGDDCDKADRLYHVKLRATDGTRTSLCGGSLIADQWVLTAAHCWKPGRTMYADVNVHPGEKLETMVITTHKIYEEHNKKHDIMLLKLPQNPQHIHKIPPPDCTTDLQLTNTFQAAGHGCDAVDGANAFLKHCPLTLQCVNLPVVNCQPIKAVLTSSYPNIPYPNLFCAQAQDKETAPGDSGGGVVYNDKIYGIVLGGHPTHAFQEPCEFLRVCPYMTWINSTISSNP